VPVPTFAANQVIASDDVNQWFVPLVAFKNADQNVTSSTVLVNDTALVLTPRINCLYWMELYLNYEGAATGTGDLKGQFTVPAGAALNYSELHNSTATITTVVLGQRASAATFAAGTNGGGSVQPLYACGTFLMGSTAGNLQFQWAQNTSTATSTTVHAGSVLLLRRIS
jgi:hypothetical protein